MRGHAFSNAIGCSVSQACGRLGARVAPDKNQNVENMEVLVSTFSQNVHAIISASFRCRMTDLTSPRSPKSSARSPRSPSRTPRTRLLDSGPLPLTLEGSSTRTTPRSSARSASPSTYRRSSGGKYPSRYAPMGMFGVQPIFISPRPYTSEYFVKQQRRPCGNEWVFHGDKSIPWQNQRIQDARDEYFDDIENAELRALERQAENAIRACEDEIYIDLLKKWVPTAVDDMLRMRLENFGKAEKEKRAKAQAARDEEKIKADRREALKKEKERKKKELERKEKEALAAAKDKANKLKGHDTDRLA